MSTNTIYKANQNRRMSALQTAYILNTCEMLLRLEIEIRGSNLALLVATDTATVVYGEATKEGMLKFLSKLKEHAVNKEDIDELLEEVQHMD
ncbi:hypothetical protein [Paenibacillus larvae]|uniref:Uncharacterized protein n=1 Tax=Paenibacillus larvae subsp. larvae TaxID=147375 RepID=A0A6C0QS93_9BACL|nr:hypothetical protein [Paenibacillus larvae]QHZ51208.1 hypothetical protein ERICV_02060 [Paenibacillus larvae subsp. larvae]QHZ52297.1 hypothetical protein ERICV_03185 [Paenibacillus larvae subsp. larvae]